MNRTLFTKYRQSILNVSKSDFIIHLYASVFCLYDETSSSYLLWANPPTPGSINLF